MTESAFKIGDWVVSSGRESGAIAAQVIAIRPTRDPKIQIVITGTRYLPGTTCERWSDYTVPATTDEIARGVESHEKLRRWSELPTWVCKLGERVERFTHCTERQALDCAEALFRAPRHTLTIEQETRP